MKFFFKLRHFFNFLNLNTLILGIRRRQLYISNDFWRLGISRTWAIKIWHCNGRLLLLDLHSFYNSFYILSPFNLLLPWSRRASTFFPFLYIFPHFLDILILFLRWMCVYQTIVLFFMSPKYFLELESFDE